jgi:hypothetical protein
MHAHVPVYHELLYDTSAFEVKLRSEEQSALCTGLGCVQKAWDSTSWLAKSTPLSKEIRVAD